MNLPASAALNAVTTQKEHINISAHLLVRDSVDLSKKRKEVEALVAGRMAEAREQVRDEDGDLAAHFSGPVFGGSQEQPHPGGFCFRN